MEDWAEIRRLHRAEGVPIKEIARRMGIARNTVRAALSSDVPPSYRRQPKVSVADVFEPQIRVLLAEWPTMPAPVIAQRIGWPHSMNLLRVRLAKLRPEYVGIDPVDRVVYEPGQVAQWDLWFPEPPVPVAVGQARVLPVLVMTLGFSRFLAATMIPSRQAGDILSGMWLLICGIGRVPKMLVWDREAAIGGSGRVTAPAAAFAGTLATRIVLAPPRDPEFKGLVERNNGYMETSFLPGRSFSSPADFNSQLAEWLARANARIVRSIQGRPVDLLETDYQAMIELPPMSPSIGLNNRIRLGRDYYVRVDTVDYSVDPRSIGRFVDVTASLDEVVVFCEGQVVARHQRSWAKGGVITDPAHQATAAALRQDFARTRQQAAALRQHADGHVVALRALPDYDALFGNEPPRSETSLGAHAVELPHRLLDGPAPSHTMRLQERVAAAPSDLGRDLMQQMHGYRVRLTSPEEPAQTNPLSTLRGVIVLAGPVRHHQHLGPSTLTHPRETASSLNVSVSDRRVVAQTSIEVARPPAAHVELGALGGPTPVGGSSPGGTGTGAWVWPRVGSSVADMASPCARAAGPGSAAPPLFPLTSGQR